MKAPFSITFIGKKSRTESAFETNLALDDIRRKVLEYRDRILFENRTFAVDTLREKWFGQDRNKMTLLEVFKLAILDLEKMVLKKERARPTLTKYKTTDQHIRNFLQWRNTGTDILLIDLRIGFAANFHYYLKVEKGLSINSSARMIINLKRVIRECVDKDWLDRDPFINYKVRHVDPKIPFLADDELKAIENKAITINRLALVRDVFVFSCYTGFAYIDVVNLTTKNIKIGVDGKRWLIKPRQKTGISERVPILPPVAHIISKYEKHPRLHSGQLIPVPSNQKVNAYLKELAAICGINKHVTFHIARHTFATTVTLENGVPMDSVSKMLGHRSIKTTQIYAKISDKKISEDTKNIFEKYSTQTEGISKDKCTQNE